MNKLLILSIFIIISQINICFAQNVIRFDTGPEVASQIQDVRSLIGIDSAFDNAIRYREVNLNTSLQEPSLIQLNDTILLNLFSDKVYKAVVEQMNIDVNNVFIIRAKLIDLENAYCVISTFQSKSFMDIIIPQYAEQYILKFNITTGQHYILDLDPDKQNYLEGSEPIIPPDAYEEDDQGPNDTQDGMDESMLQQSSSLFDVSQDTIKVMVVYSPEASNWASVYQTNIQNVIGVMMERANLVLDNSQTYLTLELVHSAEVDYVETNTITDLDNLKNTEDGFMDEIHCLRDVKQADLVVLLAKVSFTGGVAYLLNSDSGRPNSGFSLIRVQQASGTYTTIHEIGHNLGCSHHKEQNYQPGPGLKPYAAGWRWTGTDGGKYCSVMTYRFGSYFEDGITHASVPFFSNPDIQYQGVATGDPVDGDNARTIRETKYVVSLYRNEEQIVYSEILSVESEELMVNVPAKVNVNILIKQDDTYFVGIWDKTGTKEPNWDFSPDYTPISSNIGSLPTYYNSACKEQVVEFDVVPRSQSGTFEFWLYKQNSDGSYIVVDKAEFTFSAPKELEATIQVDFSLWGSTYEDWNKTINLSPDDEVLILPGPLISLHGHEYPYSIAIDRKFDGPNFRGLTEGIYPSQVMKRGYIVDESIGVLLIEGLDTAKTYNFTLFGSRQSWGNEDYTTIYTEYTGGVNGISATLNAYHNAENTVTLEQLKPDSNGKIMLSVAKDVSATKGFINAMIIEQYKVTEPLIVEAFISNPTCSDGFDGAIDLSITGGTPPYSIIWDSGHTNEDLSDLVEGIYEVTISDDLGIIQKRSFKLSNPPAVGIATELISPFCDTELAGEISLTVTGGIGPYEYKIDDQSFTAFGTEKSIINQFVASGVGYDLIKNIGTDKSGNVYVFGYSANGIDLDEIIIPAGDFILKLNNNLVPVWAINQTYFTGIIDEGGSIYLVTDSYLRKLDTNGTQVLEVPVSGVNTLALDNYGNIVLFGASRFIKLNSSGDLIWEKVITSKYIYDFSVSATDNITIGASVFDGIEIDNKPFETSTFFVAQFDSDGEMLWYHAPPVIGPTDLLVDFGGLVMDPEGNVYLAGGSDNYGQLFSGIFDDAPTSSGAFMLKYNPYGGIEWFTFVPTEMFVGLHSVSLSSMGDITATYGSFQDRHVLIFDTAGNIQQDLVTIEEFNYENGILRLCFDYSGNLVIAGNFNISVSISEEEFNAINNDPDLFIGGYGFENKAEKTNLSFGLHELIVQDNYNCTNSTTIDVGSAELPITPEICLVTKDDNSDGNMITWELPEDFFYGGFRVYRELEEKDQFVYIGGDYGYYESYYVDNEVSDDVSSHRYKIAMVGYCGNEISDLSAPHKTFHLMANRGLNGVVNLLWEPYEGFDYAQISILRGADQASMHEIDVLPGNLTSYTDISPVLDEVYYQLEIIGEDDCGNVTSNGRITSSARISRSNVVNKDNAITDIEDYQNDLSQLLIYPVPASDHINIEFGGDVEMNIQQLMFLDITGRIVLQKNNINSPKFDLDTKNLGQGIYYIRVISNSGELINKKILIN